MASSSTTSASTRRASSTLSLTKRHRLRIRFTLWAFLLMAVAVIARLIALQGEFSRRPGESAEEYAARYTGDTEILVPRGDICDRGGRLLATDIRVPSLVADPEVICEALDEPARRAAARVVAERLALDEREVLQAFTNRGDDGRLRRFAWVKHRLSESEMEALGELDRIVPKGLSYRKETVRSYPQGSLAAHVLGFANLEHQGSEGIEYVYDQHLRSEAGKRKALRAPRQWNRPILLDSMTVEYQPPKLGEQVQLTIDSEIQFCLERELEAVLTSCHAAHAMGVLMDPRDGAILAMASLPSFDPNRYWETSSDVRTNRAALAVFEPGSSFKIVTACAALEQGLVGPDTRIDCKNGQVRVYGRRWLHDAHAMGVVPFRQAFAESSNIAIAWIASQLGEESLEEWIQRFGFGAPTSRDFRPESTGMLRPRKDWSKASIVSLPMGYEISVTVLQLARAFSVIANGGYLVEPHVVARIEHPEGETTYRFTPPEPRRILHESTVKTMRELLHGVVTHGTGTLANIDDFRVCGKTGTARVALERGGGYHEDRHTTVFAGFAPLADPQICAVIVVDSPMIEHPSGGKVCGPVFQRVARKALMLLNCEPDPVRVKVAKANTQSHDADALLAGEELELLADLPDNLLASLDHLELLVPQEDLAEGAATLPDLLGKTKREALEALAAAGVRWSVRGAGWVIHQSPAPGTPIRQDMLCRLVFANRSGPDQIETLTDGTDETHTLARL